MLYVGMDIHKRFSQVAVIDGRGQVMERRRVERAGLMDVFARRLA